MDELVALLDTNFGYVDEIRAVDLAEKIRNAGYVKVTRCRDCINGRFKHQDMYECMKDADIDENTGVAYGFIDYHDPDFFCAYGERKTENEDPKIH